MNSTHSQTNDGATPLCNARQETFCQLLTGIPPLSAVAAYRKAGYNPKNAEAHASRLVENGGVSSRVAFLQQENEKLCHLKKNRALAILADMAEGKIPDILPGRDGATVTSMRVSDRRAAIETIGKLCGWFASEKVETTGIQIVEVVRHDDGRG